MTDSRSFWELVDEGGKLAKLLDEKWRLDAADTEFLESLDVETLAPLTEQEAAKIREIWGRVFGE